MNHWLWILIGWRVWRIDSLFSPWNFFLVDSLTPVSLNHTDIYTLLFCSHCCFFFIICLLLLVFMEFAQVFMRLQSLTRGIRYLAWGYFLSFLLLTAKIKFLPLYFYIRKEKMYLIYIRTLCCKPLYYVDDLYREALYIGSGGFLGRYLSLVASFYYLYWFLHHARDKKAIRSV